MAKQIQYSEYVAALKTVAAYNEQLAEQYKLDDSVRKPCEEGISLDDFLKAGYVRPDDTEGGLVALEKVIGTNDEDENLSIVLARFRNVPEWALSLPSGHMIYLNVNTLAEIVMLEKFIHDVEEPY